MPKLVVLVSRDKVDLSKFSADLGARLQYKVIDSLEYSYKILKELNVRSVIVDPDTGPSGTTFSNISFEYAKYEDDSLRQMKQLFTINTKIMGNSWLEVCCGLKEDSSNVLLIGIYSKEQLKFLREKNATIIFIDVIPPLVSQSWIENEDRRLGLLLENNIDKKFNPESSTIRDLIFFLTKTTTR